MSDFPVPQKHPAAIDHVDPHADPNYINGLNGARRTGRFMIGVWFIENGQISLDTLVQNFPNGDFGRARNLLQQITDQLEKPANVSETGQVAAVAPSAPAPAVPAAPEGVGRAAEAAPAPVADSPPTAAPPTPAVPAPAQPETVTAPSSEPTPASSPAEPGDGPDVPQPLSPIADITNPN